MSKYPKKRIVADPETWRDLCYVNVHPVKERTFEIEGSKGQIITYEYTGPDLDEE